MKLHATNMQDFQVQNVVGSCDTGVPIRLEGLAYTEGANCSVRYFPLLQLYPNLDFIGICCAV